MIDNQGNNLIFTGGAPRSGTTLLQRILDVNNEIYAGPEFNRLPMIVKLRERMLQSYDIGRSDCYFTNRASIDQHIKSFVIGIFNETLSIKNKNKLSEKSPENTLYFDELGMLFPQAMFIRMVRDPADVVQSLMNVRANALKKGLRPSGLYKSFEKAIEAILPYYKEANSIRSREYRITYIDLVNDTENVVKGLCSFLNVPFDKKMLRPSDFDHDSDKVYDDVWYSNKRLKDVVGFRPSRIKLTEFQKAYVRYRFRNTDLFKWLDLPVESHFGFRIEKVKNRLTDDFQLMKEILESRIGKR